MTDLEQRPVATMLTDHDEQVLVRRVVTIVCGLALLTVPVVHFALGGSESWVALAHVVVFGAAFAALGRSGLRTNQVVLGSAFVLWLATIVSVGITTQALLTGTGEGVGLGSGLLWLAAGMGPATFLVLDVRRALLATLGAFIGSVGTLALITGGRLDRVAAHDGVWQVVVAILVVLCGTAAVAWLAGRSAEERQRALVLRQQRAARTARLERSQQRREALFSRTSTELRLPMRRLSQAAAALEGAVASAALMEEQLARIERLAGELLDEVVEHIDGLVDRIHREADLAPEAVTDGQVVEDHGTGWAATVLITFGVFALVALDAWRTVVLVADGAPNAHAVAAAANRMIVVLFVAAAVIAVRLPGRFGWWLSGLVLLVHPVAMLGAIEPAARDQLLVPFAASWRIAALAAGMIAVLATIIERRIRDRDALVAAATDEELRSRALQRSERAAERAYAEAAHELKNPLSVIHGSAHTLAEHGARLTSTQVEQLRAALTSAAVRLDARLALMREVAGEPGQADDLRLEPIAATVDRPVVAADMLLDALAAARLAREDHPVEVELRVTEERTVAAPQAVEHVVENLLSNAHKYGEPGAAVRFTAHSERDRIIVEVANRGGGLSRADVQRMFEPYWRAGNADEHVEGTGIGLSIVARLVEQWDGRCWADVTDGWTRVGFTMPLAPAVHAPTWQQLEDQLG